MIAPAQSSASRRLRDVAVFIRSKNAGPFMLTIDVFFEDAATCERVARSGALSADAIAQRYRIEPSTIRILHVPQANAIKISVPRPLAAGDVGDIDVAGGQQFAPLLDVMVDVDQ
jgi:hypothetical protein